MNIGDKVRITNKYGWYKAGCTGVLEFIEDTPLRLHKVRLDDCVFIWCNQEELEKIDESFDS